MTTNQHNSFSPFHVPSFCSSESENPILRKDVQAEGIDTLLVKDNKIFLLVFAVHSLITNKVLELYYLLNLLIDELPFCLDQFFALFGGRVEETRIYLPAKY